MVVPTGELPGAELVNGGLADLRVGRTSEAGLLVWMAAPRLRRLGFDVPVDADVEPAGHRLFALLEAEHGAGAHSRYNALIRRISSFARAAEHALAG